MKLSRHTKLQNVRALGARAHPIGLVHALKRERWEGRERQPEKDRAPGRMKVGQKAGRSMPSWRRRGREAKRSDYLRRCHLNRRRESSRAGERRTVISLGLCIEAMRAEYLTMSSVTPRHHLSCFLSFRRVPRYRAIIPSYNAQICQIAKIMIFASQCNRMSNI
jgi:hypothetical protein